MKPQMQTVTRTMTTGAMVHFDTLRLDTDAPTLLLVHGWTCRRGYWKQQVDHLKGRYPIVVPDLPGHGESVPGHSNQANVAELADCLVELVRDEVSGPVILVGHSMGGALALEAARRIDGQAQGVILVDTFVIDFGGLDAETQQSLYRNFTDDFIGGIHWLIDSTTVDQTPEALKTRLTMEMAEADPNWALPIWRSLLTWQPENIFPHIQCPIRAINGRLVPNTARKRCRPYLREVVMPKAGHFPQLEDPARFNQLLDEALSTMA